MAGTTKGDKSMARQHIFDMFYLPARTEMEIQRCRDKGYKEIEAGRKTHASVGVAVAEKG